MYRCLFRNTVNNTYLGNTDTYLSLDLFCFCYSLPASLIYFYFPTFFVSAQNPGGGRRIGSQLQVFQSTRHRGHCRKGRRFFLPQSLVNAEIVFRTTHETKSRYVSEQSSEKVSINPDPGPVFLINPKSGCQTQFIERKSTLEKYTIGKS